MPVILGGPTALMTRKKGDLMISFQHVNGEEAMVLYPVNKRLGAGGYVICLSAAYKYVEPAYLAAASYKAASVMGFNPDMERSIVHRIADAILENLEDLVRMKPEPKELEEAGAKFGEMDLLVNGEIVTTREVLLPKGTKIH
jgi:hypothetical protein